MKTKKKEILEYSITKKDNKKLVVDDFSRMLKLVEKYLKNIQANKNNNGKQTSLISEEELEMKENSIMQTYNIKRDNENFPLLLEAHANSYLSASIEYVERKKYGKAYAKSRRQERMGKFVDYTEKAMKNLKNKSAMEDSGERI